MDSGETNTEKSVSTDTPGIVMPDDPLLERPAIDDHQSVTALTSGAAAGLAQLGVPRARSDQNSTCGNVDRGVAAPA
jgi:hypothetical protein